MQSKILWNFLLRSGVLFVVALLALYPNDVWWCLFFALVVSGGLAVVDVLFGSPDNPSAQGRRIIQVLAGRYIKTKKDKLAWALMFTMLPLAGLFATVGILGIFLTGPWIWLIGAAVALAVFIITPRVAGRLADKR